MPWEYDICRQNNIPMQVWKKVTDNEVQGVRPYYWVSNYGNVYSEVNGEFMLPHSRYPGDYQEVHLMLYKGSITFRVHRLVALLFKYNPDYENLVVNHIDGHKDHNWEWNLEWVTTAENIAHAYETGLKPRGCEAHNSKFSREEIEEICRRLENGETYSDIRDAMNLKGRTRNVNYTISDIKNGRAYASISKDYDFSNSYGRSDMVLFTDEEVEKICQILSTQLTSYLDILTQLGYDVNSLSDKEKEAYKKAITRIKTGTGHTDISSKYNIKSGRADRKLTEEQVHQICKELVNGTPTDAIVYKVCDTEGLSEKEIYNLKNIIIRIRRGICYKSISSQYGLSEIPPARRSNYHFDDVQEKIIIEKIKENPFKGNKDILLEIMDVSDLENGEIKKLTDAISYIRRIKMKNMDEEKINPL